MGYLDFQYSIVIKIGEATIFVIIDSTSISRRSCHFGDGDVIGGCFTPVME